MKHSSQSMPLGQICEDLSGSLLRYLTRCVGDRDLADDLLQEALIRIARGLPGFAGRAELKTWAFTIATRVVADHFRAHANRLRIVEIAESDDFPDPDCSVAQQLVLDEMNACVREVIDRLPGDYRTAVILHDFEGLTAAQTAEISGCSLATAKIRIHRARLRLKEALRQQCEFYHCGDNVLRCDRKA